MFAQHDGLSCTHDRKCRAGRCLRRSSGAPSSPRCPTSRWCRSARRARRSRASSARHRPVRIRPRRAPSPVVLRTRSWWATSVTRWPPASPAARMRYRRARMPAAPTCAPRRTSARTPASTARRARSWAAPTGTAAWPARPCRSPTRTGNACVACGPHQVAAGTACMDCPNDQVAMPDNTCQACPDGQMPYRPVGHRDGELRHQLRADDGVHLQRLLLPDGQQQRHLPGNHRLTTPLAGAGREAGARRRCRLHTLTAMPGGGGEKPHGWGANGRYGPCSFRRTRTWRRT